MKRWGPLFATSAFPFENYNGLIANCVHGSKHLGQEIINNIKIAQGVQALKSKYNEEFNNSHQANNSNQLLGKAKAIKNLHDTEIMLIEAEGLCFENLNFYARAKINNQVYTSQIYKIVKTNSYTVQIDTNNSSMYGSIRFFFKLLDDLCFILQSFIIEHTKIFVHHETNTKVKHVIPIKEENQYTLIKLKNIKCISHVIRVGNYICKNPNMLKKNM